jgi:hypothetical protein
MGTWPDWIAAIGSVLAFFGLVFGLWWEMRRHRKEREAEAERPARLVFGTVIVQGPLVAALEISNNGTTAIIAVQWTVNVVSKHERKHLRIFATGSEATIPAGATVSKRDIGPPPLKQAIAEHVAGTARSPLSEDEETRTDRNIHRWQRPVLGTDWRWETHADARLAVAFCWSEVRRRPAGSASLRRRASAQLSSWR